MVSQQPRGPTNAPLSAGAAWAITLTSVISACLIVCIVASVLSALHGSSNTAGTTSATAPTSPPLPTATPNPLDRGPHLGSLDTEFDKLLGQRSTMALTPTVVAGQHIELATWEAGDTTDGQGRIREIDFDPTTTTWANVQAAMPVITFFLPPDARYLRTETKDESSYGTVIHHVYTSHLLAQFIGASVFTDDLDLTTPIPPGTFEWFCWSSHGYLNGPYTGCEILTRAPAK